MSAKTLRHKCKHANRVAVRDGLGQVLRDYCQDCRAEFPTAPRGYITDEDVLDGIRELTRRL